VIFQSENIPTWREAKVAAKTQIDAMGRAGEEATLMRETQPFFSIPDLAARWRVSRSGRSQARHEYV
jgi:hypothetical protein